jgi:hypothetical protein
MKIIQIIVKKDDIYGLCDEGQLWRLGANIDSYDNTWRLVSISAFIGMNGGKDGYSFQYIHDNDLKLNLTGG